MSSPLSKMDAMEDLPFPEVPPSVLAKETVEVRAFHSVEEKKTLKVTYPLKKTV